MNLFEAIQTRRQERGEEKRKQIIARGRRPEATRFEKLEAEIAEGDFEIKLRDIRFRAIEADKNWLA